jgi:phospholipid/cholesterol/gamma-HCH transport system ATP-binding protein
VTRDPALTAQPVLRERDPAADPAPSIRIEGLQKRFASQPVLRGVDLHVEPGELMVVIGRSGGGKSVLLRHILGLVRPDAGRILIGDEDVTAQRGRALDRVREQFGVVFQGGALFDSLTVLQNVMFPIKEKGRLAVTDIVPRAQEALAQVGLADMGHKFPAEISGGMRKRVAIARALVTEPQVVFLDEPTTGLDPILVNSIHHLIVTLHRRFNFTAVMVSHEIPEIFGIADRVAVLHDGRIRQVGRPDAIESSPDPAVRQFIHGEIETEVR